MDSLGHQYLDSVDEADRDVLPLIRVECPKERMILLDLVVARLDSCRADFPDVDTRREVVLLDVLGLGDADVRKYFIVLRLAGLLEAGRSAKWAGTERESLSCLRIRCVLGCAEHGSAACAVRRRGADLTQLACTSEVRVVTAPLGAYALI